MCLSKNCGPRAAFPATAAKRAIWSERPGIAVPVLGQVFVDKFLIGGLHDWLNPLLSLVALAAAIIAVLTWLRESVLLRLEMSMSLRDSARFFWHVLHLPIGFFSQRDS